jgi:ATP-dependent RNA helicase DDX21
VSLNFVLSLLSLLHTLRQVPDDEDTFVHRSGRTGRAGREGINVVLYRAGDEAKLLQLAKTIGITFALEGSPTDSQMIQSRKVELMDILDKVPAQSMDAFKDVAMEMHETRGWQAMAAALASLAGFSESGPRSYSMLAGRPDFITVQVELSSKAARNTRGIPALRNLLQTAYPQGEFVALGKVVTLQDGATILFDMPSREFAKLAPKTAGSDDEQKILSKSEPGVAMFAAKRLPSLKELVSAMQSDGSGGRRVGGGRGSGGNNVYNGQRQRDHGRGGGGGYGGGFVDRGRPRSGGGGAYSDNGGGDYGRGRRGGSWSGGGGGQDEWGSKKSGFGGRRGDRPPRPSEWGR